MDYKYKRIPKVKKERVYYENGANVATEVTVYKCLCFLGWGRIEHHRVPGFDDDWYEIHCPICKRKYHSFIDQIGQEWKVYLK